MSTTEKEQESSSTGTPDGPVLVAYATRFGSTRGIAERIAAVLEHAGHLVELHRCENVEDVGSYTAIVIGSAVFNQCWVPEADEFIERNLHALALRPVWLFTVGTFGDRKPVIGRLMKREPRNIEQLTRSTRAAGYRVFAGVIDRQQWPVLSRLFYHALGGRLGDNRDWAAIEQWADSIGQALRHGSRALDSG